VRLLDEVNSSTFLSYSYQGKRYQDIENTIELEDFSTFDLSVSRKFFNHVELSLNVENIFDKKYIFKEVKK